jgi:hypothetical protein
MKLPLCGGCVCGAVRYELSREPLIVYVCHCTVCQRITSSAFSIGMTVPEAAFRAIGKEARQVFGGVTESGRHKTRLVCPDCGTWLFGNARPGTDYPGMVRIVRGGTLDDTSWLRPTAHYWTRSAQPWVTVPEGIAAYETHPG